MCSTIRRIILDLFIILYIATLTHYCIGVYGLLKEQQRMNTVIMDGQLRLLHYAQGHKAESYRGAESCPECLSYLREHKRLFEPAIVIYTSEYEELKRIKQEWEKIKGADSKAK